MATSVNNGARPESESDLDEEAEDDEDSEDEDEDEAEEEEPITASTLREDEELEEDDDEDEGSDDDGEDDESEDGEDEVEGSDLDLPSDLSDDEADPDTLDGLDAFVDKLAETDKKRKATVDDAEPAKKRRVLPVVSGPALGDANDLGLKSSMYSILWK